MAARAVGRVSWWTISGLWRSPVAHLVRIEGVRGSNPLSSTESRCGTSVSERVRRSNDSPVWIAPGRALSCGARRRHQVARVRRRSSQSVALAVAARRRHQVARVCCRAAQSVALALGARRRLRSGPVERKVPTRGLSRTLSGYKGVTTTTQRQQGAQHDLVHRPRQRPSRLRLLQLLSPDRTTTHRGGEPHVRTHHRPDRPVTPLVTSTAQPTDPLRREYASGGSVMCRPLRPTLATQSVRAVETRQSPVPRGAADARTSSRGSHPAREPHPPMPLVIRQRLRSEDRIEEVRDGDYRDKEDKDQHAAGDPASFRCPGRAVDRGE